MKCVSLLLCGIGLVLLPISGSAQGTIFDFGKSLPPPSANQLPMPKKTFGAKGADSYPILAPNMWKTMYSPMGQRKFGIQPGAVGSGFPTTLISPNVLSYGTLDYRMSGYDGQTYRNPNLGKLTAMKTAPAFANPTIAPIFAAHTTEDMIKTVTLGQLNRFTPMRNPQMGSAPIPVVPAGTGSY